ncbi:T9SS type B sorting domain-containing protein [Parvicella tangerina]|uniref:PKD domain-containing protein n=1 Tax=Parvicella tangerina TaxID=2829795 RepID=A0A916NCA3_9FLAO|nr:gliding motility-associated C-terminal domain-containing protein [Parvicella tangerina]CAG5084813.1 hypothetical protein CRYO30217_02573 [Parvicella tangerina]
MKKILILALSIFLMNASYCQTILFSEDFEDEVITDMTGVSSQGIGWVASCPLCSGPGDIYEVNTFGSILQGLKGSDTNGPATFTASGIDATGMYVLVLEFDYESDPWVGSGSNNLECSSECSGCSGDPADILSSGCQTCWDFLHWEISTGTFTDGGIVVGNDCSIAPSGHVISDPGCASPYDGNGNLIPGNDPSNLTLTITMAMWASDEEMIIDNVVITGYTKSEAIAAGYLTDAGDDNTVDLCTSVGTHDLFDDLLGSPDAGGVWSGPGTTTNGDQGTLDLSSLVTGDYEYITSTGAGCEDTATITVTNLGGGPNAGVTGVQNICQGETITVSGTGTGNYEWSDGSTGPTLNISSAGNYFLEVSNSCGVDTAFFNVGDLGASPVGAISGDEFVCDPSATTTLIASGGTSYVWSTSSTNASETFSGGDNGYVLIMNQCGQDSIAFSISDETVLAGFTLSDSTGEEPVTIQTTNISTNATAYSWDFGNGSASTDVSPQITFGTSGDYVVSLIASNSSCSDTVSATVFVYDPAPLVIPNIFTPNEDDVNDQFKVVHYSVERFSGAIYNRWGQKLYENTDQYVFQWDGYNESGKPAPEGTYFYILEATFKNGETEQFSGAFELVR